MLLRCLCVLCLCGPALASSRHGTSGGRYGYRGTAADMEAISAAGSVGWAPQFVEAWTRPVENRNGSFGLILHERSDGDFYLSAR